MRAPRARRLGPARCRSSAGPSRLGADRSLLRAPRPQELPPRDALAGVAGACELQDKLRLRASHTELRAAASASISTLRTLNLKLPTRAWQAFSSASGLRVEEPSAGAKGLTCYGSNDKYMLTVEALERCGRVLLALPPRVRRLHLAGDCITFIPPLITDTTEQAELVCYVFDEGHQDEEALHDLKEDQGEELDRRSRASSQQLAAALAQSPAAAHLTELLVDWEMLPAGAEQLLRACPALERLQLTVSAWRWDEGQQWRPSLPAGLTSLELRSCYAGGDVHCAEPTISPAALAPLSRLQHLRLVDMMPAALANSSLLGGLTTLRSLELDGDNGDVSLSNALTELAPLQQLSSLLIFQDVTPQAWAALAQLPRLAALHINSIQLPPLATAEPLAALTRLKGDVRIPQGAGPGALCAVLPSLLQLDNEGFSSPTSGLGLMQLLRGHPQLYSLVLRLTRSNSWPELALASLPRLRHCKLWLDADGSTSALLADLAACSSLRSIKLSSLFSTITISSADVRALAGAASSATLESFVLDTCVRAGYSEAGRVALPDALPLLQARMPQLRELRLPVLRVPEEELCAVARQLGRPLDVLRSQLVLGEH
jgi:hypothetical protein